MIPLSARGPVHLQPEHDGFHKFCHVSPSSRVSGFLRNEGMNIASTKGLRENFDLDESAFAVAGASLGLRDQT